MVKGGQNDHRMTTEFETACFGIITYVGTARSCFINAVQCAKKGDQLMSAETFRVLAVEFIEVYKKMML